MKHTCKRLTALVLALAMCFSLLAPAWAADVEAEEATTEVVAEAVEETEEAAEEEAAEETDEAEAEVAAAEVEDEEPTEDAGDAVVSAQSTKASGTWGDLTWKLDSSGTLTLSGTGSMGDSIPFAPWEDYRSSVTSVVIGDGVVAIVVGAFSDHSNLKSVTIGNGVTGIYNSAFEYCTSLTSVTIGSNVTTIESWAFYVCPSLKSVTIPANVTTIEYQAFGYTYSGKKVSGFTIYGYDGTAAQTYAESNGFTFVSLGEATPAAPTLSSVSNTSSGVKITWKAVSGVTGYRVYRKAAGDSSWTNIKSSTTSTSYTDTTVKSGTTYYYTVRAYTKVNGTNYWGSYNSTGLSIKYLTAGKISSLTNTSSGITVKWSKVTGASGYYVYRKTSSGSYSRIATIKSGSTVSYSDTAVKSNNGTTYTYAVRPYSGSYTGSYTGKTTARLTGVSISSLKNSSSKKMTVKWGKNSKATGYLIQYSTSSSFSSVKTITVTSASTVSKTISSLTKGKTYYVRVRAYKTVSGTKYYSAWSSTKNVKISK